MVAHQTRPLAVVTGASSGIGLELAREFARNGFDLLLCAEDGRLAQAARQVGELGTAVESFQADLATHEGVDQLYARIQAGGRPVDALALNAGVGAGGAFLDNPLEEELNLIRLNIISTVHLAKHVLADMVKEGRGRVLITSSVAAETPGPFAAVYNASKAFGFSFAEALRNELKDTGVTVTALLPGPTDTNFFRRAGMTDTKVAQGDKADPADVARIGFEALMDGKDHVVAGNLRTRAESAMSGIVPETAKAAAHRKVAEPGSADD